MVKLDLKSLMANPQRSIRFETLHTCPYCKDQKSKNLEVKHSPYFCLSMFISTCLADEPVGIQASKVPDKVTAMIGEINRKRLLAGIFPPIMIEEETENFRDNNMSADTGFHD